MKNPSQNTDKLARIIWDYMLMHNELRKCDAILTLCSIDDRVAEFAADLFLKGYGTYLVFSGGIAHDNDLLNVRWTGSEAEHFAKIAFERGVPEDKVIIENKATNTGENIRFSYEALQTKGIFTHSLLLVQKPYMERRTFATFQAQWPGKQTEFIVASPPISFNNYFDDNNQKEKIINIMVGDLQRIKEYPKLGYQSEQAIPDSVWQAYEGLIKHGYVEHLIES